MRPELARQRYKLLLDGLFVAVKRLENGETVIASTVVGNQPIPIGKAVQLKFKP